MGQKRALLVGINYDDDPDNKLRGCWNDVERMGECLVSRYGFPKETICTLVDRPGTNPRMMPTGEVIREKLGALTRDLQWGDCIFFHFSGHGVQLPPEGEPDETGMKEAIVPVDLNLITDDDFRILVDKIPDGVAFTFIADCCHSGGLIAHCEQQVGSVYTKPTSLLSSLGPQLHEEEGEEEEAAAPGAVSEEVMIEVLASMLGSVSSHDPSVSVLEILAVMEAANSANQELSLLDLLALYVASQQHNVSMSDILESMLAEEESAPERPSAAQKKAFSISTGSLQRDRQLKKDRIQHMLGSTKAYNVQRLLRSSHSRRSLSTRGAPHNASYGGHQHYPPQDQNRSGFFHHHSEPILPHQHYAYPPPDIAGHFYNDASAPWQYPPPALKHTVSDPGAYAHTHAHAHAGAPHPGEPNPFGAHPSMQRWGSDLGGGGGYGIPDHDRHSGQGMHFQPPWAPHPAVDTAPGLGHNHGAGFFMGDVYGPTLAQAGGGATYTKKRSMPVHAVTRKLSERAGRRVEAGNIRANLYDLFGDKSSITCKAVVATILDGLTNKGGSSSARGVLQRISSKSIDFLSSKLHDPKMRMDKYLRATTTPTTLQHVPRRPDRCVLITACQSDELANEHREVVHGAFTKAILDIVEEHKASPLDNHRLVYESRHRLAQKPYQQHPCLYSTPQQAHHVFICY